MNLNPTFEARIKALNGKVALLYYLNMLGAASAKNALEGCWLEYFDSVNHITFSEIYSDVYDKK